MKSRYENLLTMFKTVITVCNEYSGTIAAVPAINSDYTAFKVKVNELEQAIQHQILDISGIAEDKKNLILETINKTLIFAGALHAWADTQNDQQLKREVNYSKSDLLRLRDDLMIEACNVVYERANVHIAELAAYGLDAASLADLQSSINNCSAKNTAPVTAREHRKWYTARVKQLIREANGLLKQRLDKSIRLFSVTEPEVHDMYYNSRVIIDLHGKTGNLPHFEPSGVIIGAVLDAETGDPLEGAEIKLVESALILESDEDGEYFFEKVPIGEHTLRVIKEGYLPYNESGMAVANDDEITKDILLVKQVIDGGNGSGSGSGSGSEMNEGEAT